MTEKKAPYRKNLVGLPLQRSLFSKIHTGAELLGAADLFEGGVFGARLDEHGDLYLDKTHVERLRAGLAKRLDKQHLAAMDAAHRAACEALSRETEAAHAAAVACSAAEARLMVGSLGSRIAAVLPYGVLTKFVPDLLLGALASLGDTSPPPFPHPSPGASLSYDLMRLTAAIGPRIALAHGEVDPRVRAFCEEHAGFGPLAWESPGHDEPAFVLRTIAMAFTDMPAAQLAARLAAAPIAAAKPPPPAAADATEAATLRAVLAYWLDFLERETWYVRRAFYRGVLPLLRRLHDGGPSPETLLFLRVDEIADDARGVDVEPRMAAYFADSGYLAKHGVAPERLRALFA